jgi:hypothetical protein
MTERHIVIVPANRGGLAGMAIDGSTIAPQKKRAPGGEPLGALPDSRGYRISAI